MHEQNTDSEPTNTPAAPAPPGQTATTLLLVVSGLALMLWPAFALSHLLGLLGFHAHPDGFVTHPIAWLFLFASTVYPLVWGGCLWLSVRARRAGRIGAAIRIAALPVAWLVVSALLFAGWTAAVQ